MGLYAPFFAKVFHIDFSELLKLNSFNSIQVNTELVYIDLPVLKNIILLYFIYFIYFEIDTIILYF
jgi:hypothetical protein